MPTVDDKGPTKEQLIEQLRALGLPVSGNKAELQARLVRIWVHDFPFEWAGLACYPVHCTSCPVTALQQRMESESSAWTSSRVFSGNSLVSFS